MPVITLCQVSSFVGQHRRDGERHILRFSTSFDLPEPVLEDTVIHEMIHYFISYNGLLDRTAHGPLFKAMMQSINENHGRNINISHKTSPGEMDSARSARKKWHVIAILHFRSGETGVKVLPRVVPKIIDYYNGMIVAPNIKSVDLYLHNDPYFNRFPTSVGRRCHAISPVDASQHLQGAHHLYVKGSKLIQQ